MKSKFNKSVRELLEVDLSTPVKIEDEKTPALGPDEIKRAMAEFVRTRERDYLLKAVAGLMPLNVYTQAINNLNTASLDAANNAYILITDKASKMINPPGAEMLPKVSDITTGQVTKEASEPISPDTAKSDITKIQKNDMQLSIQSYISKTTNILKAAHTLAGPTGGPELQAAAMAFFKEYKDDPEIQSLFSYARARAEETKKGLTVAITNSEKIYGKVKADKIILSNLIAAPKLSIKAPQPNTETQIALNAPDVNVNVQEPAELADSTLIPLDFRSHTLLEAIFDISGIDDVIRMILQFVIVPIITVLDLLVTFFEKYGRILVTDWLLSPFTSAGGFIIRVGLPGLSVGDEIKKGINFILDLLVSFVNWLIRMLKNVMFFGGGGSQ